MMDNQKHLFNLPEDISYINCAYMAPLMKSVEEAGIKGMLKKRNPVSVSPDDFFNESEELRKLFSRLIKNDDPSRAVIIPSVSYGMANVARNVKFSKNDYILISGHQFPSNVYAWKQVAEETGVAIKIIFPPEDLIDRGEKWNEEILKNINENTRLVALPHTHWADGTKFNLKAIREKLNLYEGLLAIDGTQSVGALDFSVKEIRPDALVCAGYKWLMGPYALGMAYYGEYFNNGAPIEQNWISRKNSQNFTNLVNYQPNYQPGALRYEVGERSNFILVPMLIEALKQIERWGLNNIQQYCSEIIADAIGELNSKGFYIEAPEFRGNHLFGIYLPDGKHPEDVKAALEKEKIYVSIRGASVRVSPHLYNSKQDIDRLKNVLLNI